MGIQIRRRLSFSQTCACLYVHGQTHEFVHVKGKGEERRKEEIDEIRSSVWTREQPRHSPDTRGNPNRHRPLS